MARRIPIEPDRKLAFPKVALNARNWLIAEGAILAVLGILAFALPLAAGLAAALVFGWLLLLGGVVSLVHLARTRRNTDWIWRVISAIASVVAGVLVLIQPWVGAWTLAILAAVYFLVSGAALAMVALRLKQASAPGWYWLLVPAVANIVLGIVAVFLSPLVAPLFVGYLVGINLIFSGLSLVAFAGSRRSDAWG